MQGGGRKLLGHFKSHFGSKISLKSIRQVHILRMKPKFAIKMSLVTVRKRWIVSKRSVVLPTSAPRKRARHYWKTDLDQTSVAHTHTDRHKCDIIFLFFKLTFCCKLWLYLLDMALIGWFWYLWPKMAFKMSQAFTLPPLPPGSTVLPALT